MWFGEGWMNKLNHKNKKSEDDKSYVIVGEIDANKDKLVALH